MIAEQPSGPPVALDASRASDRCRFGPSFDAPAVGCSAFQRVPFVAATSYGKPLGTHVACAHLQVGESSPNQFYPRCALGSDVDRMRWIAMMGPGKIEVLRALSAEFETLYAPSLQRLIAAKAAVLADGDDGGSARLALAQVVRAFLEDFDAFVRSHESRIEEIGVSTGDLTSRAARALSDWQRSQRLDLPRSDDGTGAWAETREPGAAEVDVTRGLVITRSVEPSGLELIGGIDEANLALLVSALDELAGTGLATVDVSAVTFCSIAGLRALTRAVQAGAIRLKGTPPHMQRALGAAGLADIAAEGATAAGVEAAS
jgi:hypothetical protein